MLLNLLPILPLDGGRIVASLLPTTRGVAIRASSSRLAFRCCCCCFSYPCTVRAPSAWILSPLLFESEALIRAMVLL